MQDYGVGKRRKSAGSGIFVPIISESSLLDLIEQ